MKFLLSSLSGKVKERVLEIDSINQLLKLNIEFGDIIIAEPDLSIFSRSKEHATLMIFDDDL
jgi:hypothetical protein